MATAGFYYGEGSLGSVAASLLLKPVLFVEDAYVQFEQLW
jgi:hypothetical protein